jgi:phage-related protein (TIGR01555 family)
LAKTKRQDGFTNAFLGSNIKGRDPFASTRYQPGHLLTDQQLAAMYYGDGLVRRIVDLPAEEAVKNWIKVCGDEEEELAIQMLDDLNAEEHFANAVRWSRLFGGSAILLSVNDGGTLEDELRENNITEIETLKVYDKREVIIQNAIINDDDHSRFFGMPEWYQFNPADGTLFYAHRSRVLLFDGEPLPNRERLQRQGWGMSCVQGLFDSLARNDDSYRLARMIMERMSQSVTKFEGLLEQLASDDGEEQVKTRLQLIDMARSILNTVAIDAKDDFQLHNMNLSQIPEMIDRFGLYVCALTGIPFTVLFGRSPAGLSATGQSDNEIFYSLVRRLQKRRLKGNIDKLVRLLMLSRHGLFRGVQLEKWNVEFNPIWMPSEKEQAETRKLNADADKAEADTATAYANINALDGSEVRQMLAADSKYSEHMDMTLDVTPEPEPDPEEVVDDGETEK